MLEIKFHKSPYDKSEYPKELKERTTKILINLIGLLRNYDAKGVIFPRHLSEEEQNMMLDACIETLDPDGFYKILSAIIQNNDGTTEMVGCEPLFTYLRGGDDSLVFPNQPINDNGGV